MSKECYLISEIYKLRRQVYFLDKDFKSSIKSVLDDGYIKHLFSDLLLVNRSFAYDLANAMINLDEEGLSHVISKYGYVSGLKFYEHPSLSARESAYTKVYGNKSEENVAYRRSTRSNYDRARTSGDLNIRAVTIDTPLKRAEW